MTPWRSHYDCQIERSIAFYRERCEVLLAAVERRLEPVMTVIRPLGGGHLWLTFHDRLDERDKAATMQRSNGWPTSTRRGSPTVPS